MKISRRQLLCMGSIVGAGAVLPSIIRGSAIAAMSPTANGPMSAMSAATAPMLTPYVFVTSPPLSKFSQALRGVYPLDPNGIPVAVPDGTVRYLNGRLLANHYSIDIAEYEDQLHPDLPSKTRLWGFHSRKNLGDTPTKQVAQRHLGGIIVAQRNVPVQITFKNKLPRRHVLPVDPTIMGAEGAPNRTCVHLHGGAVPWISDGGPFAWFRPNDDPTDITPLYGPSAESGALNIYKVLNPQLKAGEAEYYYPMNQSARFCWYHDHSVGITRLNAYAGIASGVIIRDDFERSLVKKFGLPDFIENGGRELPLVIQDKIFQDESQDPAYPGISATGSLWYPYRYTDRWDSVPGSDAATLPISCIPEMFGDTMLVNGVVHPKVAIEPRRYRLRVLNATQARFLNFQLYEAKGPVGAQLPAFSKPGPDFLVLGTEGGFLAHAVKVGSGHRLNVTTDAATGDRSVDPANPGGSLLTGPAERWDVVVDFSGFAGKSLILYNDTPAPFPGGDQLDDGPLAIDGAGRTILLNQMIMRFDVAATTTGPADPPFGITDGFRLAADRDSGIDPALVSAWGRITTSPLAAPAGVRVRKLTLNELFDEHGRLIQMVGANQLGNPLPGFTLDPAAPGANLNKTTALGYMDPVTESPQVGDVEVWEIANLTSDVHPMHFHLVNVQVLSRIPFAGYEFNAAGRGNPTGLGRERGPDATELGWKETVRMNPGEVTRIIMQFNMPPVPFAVPKSPRVGDNEFVWHCHILEHEEHDMMRPLVVRGAHPRMT
jgi:spore coat protein A, manganese oxidase